MASEPLAEDVEVSWIEFFNRFETVIYPTVFEGRGVSFEQALLLYELANMRSSVEELCALLRADRD